MVIPALPCQCMLPPVSDRGSRMGSICPVFKKELEAAEKAEENSAPCVASKHQARTGRRQKEAYSAAIDRTRAVVRGTVPGPEHP